MYRSCFRHGMVAWVATVAERTTPTPFLNSASLVPAAPCDDVASRNQCEIARGKFLLRRSGCYRGERCLISDITVRCIGVEIACGKFLLLNWKSMPLCVAKSIMGSAPEATMLYLSPLDMNSWRSFFSKISSCSGDMCSDNLNRPPTS